MIRAYGIDHATLTISNLDKTRKFYEQLFDTKFTNHKSGSFNLLPAGIPVWFVQWEKKYPHDRFDERRIGLDHLAFELRSISVLKQVIRRLDIMGIANAGLQYYADKYPYVAFRDPDNIQIEFFISRRKKVNYES